MWSSRLLSFLALAALAAFGAGALELASHRDPALAESGSALASAESRGLAAEIAGALSQQRRVAEAAAADADIGRSLNLVTGEMASHVRSALLDPALQKLAANNRPYNFVLLDPAGNAAAASAPDLASGWDVPLAEVDRQVDGKKLKTPRSVLWAIVRPVPWTLGLPSPVKGDPTLASAPPPPVISGRIVVLGPTPIDVAVALRADARSGTSLVVLEAAKPTGPGADSALAAAVTGIFPGKTTRVEADGRTWHATRTLVPGVHEFYVVLAWPTPATPTLEQLGGIGSIFSRVSVVKPATQVLLGAAFLAWLLSLVLQSLSLRHQGRRLRGILVQDRAAFPQPPSRWPGHLRPAIEALNAHFARASAPPSADSVDLPAAAPSARPTPGREASSPPAAPSLALPPATASIPAEASSERSVERSVERSAERSAEKSTEAPTDKVPERGTLRLAEKPKAPPPPPRPAPPPPPAPPRAAPRPPAPPALDRDDAEPETQTDIELRPAAVAPGLLSRLREEKALLSTRTTAGHDNTAIRPVPAELLSSMRDDAGRETGVGKAPQPSTPEDDVYFESVWQEFCSTKARCGEPVDPADFRKFRARLIRTRAKLIEEYKCREVRFRVYIKDGKAGLRASPVLEEDAPDA